MNCNLSFLLLPSLQGVVLPASFLRQDNSCTHLVSDLSTSYGPMTGNLIILSRVRVTVDGVLN
jgi:hypothetical protein